MLKLCQLGWREDSDAEMSCWLIKEKEERSKGGVGQVMFSYGRCSKFLLNEHTECSVGKNCYLLNDGSCTKQISSTYGGIRETGNAVYPDAAHAFLKTLPQESSSV